MNLPYDPGQRRQSGANWSRINQWLLWIGLVAAVAWMLFRHNGHLLQLLPTPCSRLEAICASPASPKAKPAETSAIITSKVATRWAISGSC